MIIYGWRTCESVVGAGAFGCPSCRTQQSYRHVVHKRWFTLYFIPLFPLGHVGEQVECQGCFSRFGPESLYGGHVDEPMMAIVIDEQGKLQQPLMSQPSQLLQPMRPQVFGPLAQAPKMSQLAIASLILGLLSPVLLCVFGLSLLTSLGAIVTGHLALGKIKSSPFQLAGHGQAITGLVLGYLFLVASIGTWAALGPAVYEAWQRDQQAGAKQPDSNSDRLLSAEMRVLTVTTEGVATGNTAAAKELAGDYAEALQAMAGMLFTKDRERSMSLTDGHFVVHCERHPGRCAFIVHVPSYRDFSDDAKALLEARAWQLAEQSVAGELQPGDSLALGLRGSVKYGAVMTGVVGNSNGSSFTRCDRDSLVAFFPANDREPPVVPGPIAVPAPAERAIAAVPPSVQQPVPTPAADSNNNVATRQPPGFMQPPPGFGQPPPGFGQPPPPGFAPGPGNIPPPGFGSPPFAPGFVPPPIPPPVPPRAEEESPNAETARLPSAPDGGRPRPAETLDEIIEVLKAGPPTFARLFSPLHRLRDIEPDPARREEVAELLDPLLTAENSSVRRSAQEAVKVWGTQKNVPTLLRLIDGRDSSDRWAAMEALGKIGGSQEAASKLASLMLDSRDALRARRALEDMGPLAEDVVWPIVGNGDNQLHGYACQVLGKIGTSKTLVKLKALRKDPEFGRQASIDSAVRNLERRLKQQR